jgi:sugar/nucleoside kinase (ribokinase family)
MPGKMVVSGVGCCLVDVLYNNVDFNCAAIRPFLSRQRGDAGLAPGKLVFQEEFEAFSGHALDQILPMIIGGRKYDKINIGGPSVVTMIHVSQLTDNKKCEVHFYGRGGNDPNGRYLLSALNRTPVFPNNYKLIDNRTPSTIVFSDPSFHDGLGERMFINSIGAAWNYRPEEIGDDFFHSDIVVFGGTALVPHIHDHLTTLLEKAKSRGCITIVNTVFDFRNEKISPSKRWPLGESDESYRYIDLLITDREEASRLSGENDPVSAIKFFRDHGLPALIITQGAENVLAFSEGSYFQKAALFKMPVSEKIKEKVRKNRQGDTTGCGDNFAGGIIVSLITQLQQGMVQPDLCEACCWGIVSGGFTCFYIGGTYLEKTAGEKLARIRPYYESYKKQIGK